MNRQKRFRVWDVENRKMFSWAEALHTHCKVITPEGNETSLPLLNIGLLVSKEKLVVMEYIGYKDKNKKYIFEGDILTFKYGLNEGETDKLTREQYIEYLKASTKIYTGIVEWNQESAGFIISSMDKCSNFQMLYVKEASIVGNIFESPEI